MNEKRIRQKGMLKKWFFPYFLKHKKVLALDLFCAALTTGCEIVLPMIVREITSIATTDISKLTFELILSLAGIYLVLKIIDMAAGNPRFPRLLPGTLGNFPGCL